MQTSAQAGNTWLGQFDGISPLIRHRALLWQFIVRNVELRHKGSHLGLIWSFLNPLLMLGLYVLVFGKLRDPSHNAVTNALSIFIGLSLFHLIAEVLAVAPTVILGNPNFVKKVVFPLEILPVATIGAAFFHFLISIGLTLLGIAILGPGLDWSLFWLPVIFAPFLFFSLGVAWAISAIGVFFRDVAQFTGFMSLALMFASAIFYPVSMVDPSAWRFLRFNPLIHAIELSRDAMIRHQPLNGTSLFYIYGVGVSTVIGGYWVFRKLRPAFADVL